MLSKTQKEKLKEIYADPIKWAQVFLRTFDARQKKIVPWTARWYQVNMLRDKARRKVYRCGRRIGKTETMVVDMLHMAATNKNFRILVAAPYENQVRNIFNRLQELIAESPLVKATIVSTTKSPAVIKFDNGSAIVGFTTGDDASSVRGQRSDWIFIDEVDFMSEYCFEVVAAIAIERAEIGITVSSTPLGKRSKFYQMCTNPALGYSQHYHPSMHNPNWNDVMEAELRAELTNEAYVHEVLAEFGTQERGVFDKNALDKARDVLNYAYNELDFFQNKKIKEENLPLPVMLNYNESIPAPANIFRTMGVDFDKYQASSSLLILDFDVALNKFKVFKRIELPRSEYSYDTAYEYIIKANTTYNPSFIYCDRGSGEYLIERLHIYGDKHPETNLKNKVKGWSFANKLDIMDPITKTVDKKPLKQFMVNQLQLVFERNRMILSPYDDIIYKQLVDYEVEKITEAGIAKFTSENEHFVDALGLAYLAMVLEFKQLTGTIEAVKNATKIASSKKSIGVDKTPLVSLKRNRNTSQSNIIDDDHPYDKQRWIKGNNSSRGNPYVNANSGWGSRFGGSFRSSGGFSR